MKNTNNGGGKTERYYTKQDKDIYMRLKPDLASALEHAERLGRFDVDEPTKAISEMGIIFETARLNQLFASRK